MNVIGIDLGGTKIALAKYALPSWELLSEEVHPTPAAEGIDQVILKLVELIEAFRDDETQSIGIGMPGPVIDGCIESFPNIPGAENFCLEKSLQTALKTPVKLENDANAFIVGAWQLQFPEKNDLLGLTLGTGVGGALIINGQLYRGHNGAAGEFGHMTSSGKRLEDLISGTALGKRWQEKTGEKRAGKDIVADAEAGEQAALEFLQEIGQDLGRALHDLILAFNPEVLLIGGSASSALPFFREALSTELDKTPFHSTVQIPVERILDAHAATYGAAWLSQ